MNKLYILILLFSLVNSCNEVTQEERDNASRSIEATQILHLIETYYRHNSNSPKSFDKLKDFIIINSLADAVKVEDWNDLMNHWEIAPHEIVSSEENVIVAFEKTNDSKVRYYISYCNPEKTFKLSNQYSKVTDKL